MDFLVAANPPTGYEAAYIFVFLGSTTMAFLLGRSVRDSFPLNEIKTVLVCSVVLLGSITAYQAFADSHLYDYRDETLMRPVFAEDVRELLEVGHPTRGVEVEATVLFIAQEYPLRRLATLVVLLALLAAIGAPMGFCVGRLSLTALPSN